MTTKQRARSASVAADFLMDGKSVAAVGALGV